MQNLVYAWLFVVLAYFIWLVSWLINLKISSMIIKQEIAKEQVSILSGVTNNLNSIAAVIVSYSKQVDAETDKIKKAKLINNKKIDLLV